MVKIEVRKGREEVKQKMLRCQLQDLKNTEVCVAHTFSFRKPQLTSNRKSF